MKPTAAVIGLGDYYSKLRPGLRENFDCVALLDSNEAVKDLLPVQERHLFKACSDPGQLGHLLHEAQVVLVLTPTHFHLPYVRKALALNKAVVVEKPLAASTQELKSFQELASQGANLYCSDFYVDIRALPLLLALGLVREDREGPSTLVREEGRASPRSLMIGQLVQIEGRIAEDYPFRRGNWTAEFPSGGVILEMMVHLFALTKRIFPSESIRITKSERLYVNSQGVRGKFVPQPATLREAESYALVTGELIPSDVRFSFEVAKQAPQTDRYFKLIGTDGTMTQFFHPGHPLEVMAGRGSSRYHLAGDHYALACRAIRKWFDGGAREYGAVWSVPATESAIAARAWRDGADVTPKAFSTQKKSSAEEHEKIDRTRRSFGAGLIAAFLGGTQVNNFLLGVNTIMVAKNNSLLSDANKHEEMQLTGEDRNLAVRSLEAAAERSGEFVDSDQLATISKLVGNSERLILSPGTEHLDVASYEGRGYPHDLSALAPFRHLIRGPILDLDLEHIPEYVRRGDILVTTGSPTSSLIAREVMAASPIRPYVLPYRIEEIPNSEPVYVNSGMMNKDSVAKRAKRLIDAVTSTEMYSDRENVDEARRLKRDVLLISRVPSQFTDCDLLMVSGGHGPGTQAIELLFDSRLISSEDLKKLLRDLRGERYWQIVLVASEISHTPGKMSVAHCLEVSTRCPPKVIELTSSDM